MKSAIALASVALFAATTSSVVAEFTYVPMQWPPVKTSALRPVNVNENFLQGVDLSKIPGNAVTGEVPRVACPNDGQNYNATGSCWWSCGYDKNKNCLRETDLSTCKPNHFSLTYDDGPSPNATAGVLDMLKTNNVKATFCLQGPRIVQYPELARRVRDEGHDLCLHSWAHWPMTNLTNEQIVSDIKWGEMAFKRVLGIVPKYFRPPHGSVDDRVRAVIELLGYKVLMWNFSTGDTRLAHPETTTDAVFQEFNMYANKTYANGVIFLQHDSFAQSLEYSAKVLPYVLSKYTAASISQCTDDPKPYQSLSDYNTTDTVPTEVDGKGTGELNATSSAAILATSSALFAVVAASVGLLQI